MGGFGVRLFFVLSAFLLTRLLLIEHSRSGRIDKRSFYLRRTLRIWPLYFFYVGVCALVGTSLFIPALEPDHLLGTLTFTLNWFQALDPGAGAHSALLWSVAIEEQMYLMWPVLLALALPRHPVAALLGLGALGVLSQVVIAASGFPMETMWAIGPTSLGAFAFGALLAIASERLKPVSLSRGLRILLVVAGLVVPSFLRPCSGTVCTAVGMPSGPIRSSTAASRSYSSERWVGRSGSLERLRPPGAESSSGEGAEHTGCMYGIRWPSPWPSGFFRTPG
jgi:peptidoglycan/LPS O-acetylase OafA/YrhL